MDYSGNNLPSRAERIYTLAESGTHLSNPISHQVVVAGEGTEIINNPSLLGRAKRKTITRRMTLSLIDVARKKGDTERIQPYWNAYHCQSKIIISGDRAYSNYCKNRFCTICCAIRKADIINRYYPTLSEWEDTHFVTLTVKSIKEEKLKTWIDGMLRAFKLIKDRCKKRYSRDKGIKLIGVKSLECNFNPIKRWYNPHFHIIVPSREIADLLKREWMKTWTSKHTYRGAQDIRKVEDLERDLIEIIKYGSKIFTDPDLRRKPRGKSGEHKIYAYALHNILTAMSGRRLFDRFGFNLPPQKPNQPNYKLIQDFDEWLFPPDMNDWINPQTGECLTGYLQPLELSYLLSECVDLSLH